MNSFKGFDLLTSLMRTDYIMRLKCFKIEQFIYFFSFEARLPACGESKFCTREDKKAYSFAVKQLISWKTTSYPRVNR